MSAVGATIVALAAGIVEGKSVLDHLQQGRRREENDSTTGGTSSAAPSTIVPSIMYGFASLPLTVIGASPNIRMIQPNLPPIDDTVLDNHTPSSATSEGKPRRRLKLDPQDKIEKMEGTGTADHENFTQQYQMKQLNIQRVREENRQALSSKNFTHNQIVRDSYASSHFTAKSNGRSLSTYIATLDGRPLPTPLAESMRRLRILACSYGLVSLAIAYQVSLSNDSETEHKAPITTQMKAVNTGRDIGAIQNFVKKSHIQNGNGVAMRLFSNQKDFDSYIPNCSSKEIKSGNQSDCIVPIVSSNINESSKRNCQILHWTLGSNESAWNELPIDSSWFFQHDTMSFLVFESQVCSTFQSSIEDFVQKRKNNDLEHQSKEIIKIQESILDAKKIQKAAIEKNLANEHSHPFELVHVFVGSGADEVHRNVSSNRKNEIYIAGLDPVAHCLLDQIKTFQLLAIKEADEILADEQSSTLYQNQSDDEIAENANPIIIVEGLGKYIRESGLKMVKQLGRTLINLCSTMIQVSNENDTTIHIFSDKPEIEEWLHLTLLQRNGIKLKCHKCRSHDIDESDLAQIPQEDIILILCSNDTTTMHVASSIISHAQEMNCTKFITLLDTVSSKDTFEALTKTYTVNDKIISSVISVASVYDELFAMTRNMLKGGKSVLEAKEALDDLYR